MARKCCERLILAYAGCADSSSVRLSSMHKCLFLDLSNAASAHRRRRHSEYCTCGIYVHGVGNLKIKVRAWSVAYVTNCSTLDVHMRHVGDGNVSHADQGTRG